MEKIKKVIVKDMDNECHFDIGLFPIQQGLKFIDKIIGVLDTKKNISIVPFIDELLPLASYRGANGEEVVISSCNAKNMDAIIENPLTLIELAWEVFNHQKVFLEKSTLFQPLAKRLDKELNTLLSDFTTE